MGQHNRQRRAAKQRRRARQERGRPHEERSAYSAAFFLSALLRALAEGGFVLPGIRDAFDARPTREQQDAVQAEFTHTVEALFAAGWTPLDLAEFGRRTAPEPAGAYLLGVAAAATAAHPTSRVHPRWRAQLDQLRAHAAPPRPDPLAWPELADDLITLLAGLVLLPVVHPVLPQPGADPTGDDMPSGIDPKTLRRVRLLLAKAESTEFEDEADALSATAQRLMTQYSIDHALAAAPAERPPRPSTRRLWLDNPYVLAKALLVAEVASANRCRCAITERLGFVTLIGFDTDLDVVDLLTTSLLVQATRAMRLAGSHTTRSGVSRTRSFRQSFLVAYAGRIGERLRESADSVAAEQDAERAGRLVPVLAARDRAVDADFAAAFPHLVSRDVSVTNPAGWGAGRAAADLALFDIHGALAGADGGRDETVRTSA